MADERLQIADLLMKAGLSASEASKVQVAMNLAAALPTSGGGGGGARREVLVEDVPILESDYANVRSFNRETIPASAGGTGSQNMNIIRFETQSWGGFFSEHLLIHEGDTYVGDKFRQVIKRNLNYGLEFEAGGTTKGALESEMDYHLWGGDAIRAYYPNSSTYAHNLGTKDVRCDIRLNFSEDPEVNFYAYIPCPCLTKDDNSCTVTAGGVLMATAGVRSYLTSETFDPETATVDLVFYTYEE